MPLNPVARNAIEELRRVHGVANLTPDEIVELNDLGAAQLAAARSEDGDVTSPPVRVGNVLLHPMTCAAADFIERWSSVPLPRRARMLLVPFAMARGREPDALFALACAKEVVRAVREFGRRAGATPDELDEASAALLRAGDAESGPTMREHVLAVCDWIGAWNEGMGGSIRALCLARLAEERRAEEVESPAESMHWRKLSVRLGAITGVSPDYWYAEDRVLALHGLRAAIRHGRQGGADEVPQRVVDALAALRAAMKRIVELRKGADKKEAAK